MRLKLPLLAVLVGVFPVALGATLAWSGRSDNASAANPTPTVIATIPVGTSPRLGVGVNSATNRIYVVNVGGNNVSVIDGATNAVDATVPVGSGPVGVGVNPATNRIYVTCSMEPVSDDVSVIDGATDTEIDTDGNPANGITRIPVGAEPQGVAVNPATNRIYTANDGSNDVSVVGGGTNTVVVTVSVGRYPYGAAVNPATNRIYVTNRDDNTVSVIYDPVPVGGIAELPEVAGAPLRADHSAGANQVPLATGVSVIAAVALGLAGSAWYARRRWLR